MENPSLLPKDRSQKGIGNYSGMNSMQSRRVSASSIQETASVADDILNCIGFGSFQILAFCLAGLTYFGIACETLTFVFINIEVTSLWNLDAVTFAVLPAVTCAANVIGGLLFAYLSDKYGRVWPYATCMSVVSVFVAASAFSPSYSVLVIIRAMVSFGIGGILNLTHPMLIEFLPTRNRGKVAVLVGLVQAIGSCAVAGIAWWLVPNYKRGWRYFIMATSIPSILSVIYRLLFHFESPRYLVSRGRCQEAWNTFSSMAKMNGKELTRTITREEFEAWMRILQQRAEDETNLSGKLHSSLLSKFTYVFKPLYLRRTVCFVLVYCLHNLGFYGSTLFLPNVLQSLGVDPYFSLFTSFLAQIPGILLMSILIEWPEFGRLNTLRLFTALTTTFFFLFAFVQNVFTIPIFIVLIYFAMVPVQSLLFTYISESFPTVIRTMVLALVTVTDDLNGLWTPFASGFLEEQSVKSTWLFPVVWGSVFSLQLIVSFILKHETRGKTLQDSLPMTTS